MMIDFDAAHEREDPSGYSVTHADDNGRTVLVLTRLGDGAEVGRFTDRDSLDEAAREDRGAPVGLS